MKWLVVLLTDLHVQEGGALHRCKEAARALNSTLSFLYGAPLFLDRNESLFVYTKGMSFLQVYTSLASEMFSSGRWYLYPLFPKIHAVHHVWHQVREDTLLYGFSMNPLTASCQQDEDVVGRVSRVSRRVNVRRVMRRTLERHLMASYKVWKKAKIIV
jgi:hypothetical protein